jgi:NTP pyrophosphatase (non-canonical NTP hydrolase)
MIEAIEMTDKEREILIILQEECAEVIQAISKIHRFGMDSEYDGKTNKESLIQEIGDALALVYCLTENNIIDINDIQDAMAKKVDKLKEWSNIHA